MKLTPFRREVLTRLAEAPEPLSIDEAHNGHPNIMPTLIRAGWAEHALPGMPGTYTITEAGRAVLEK